MLFGGNTGKSWINFDFRAGDDGRKIGRFIDDINKQNSQHDFFQAMSAMMEILDRSIMYLFTVSFVYLLIMSKSGMEYSFKLGPNSSGVSIVSAVSGFNARS